ncbi:MAG: FG-GAP repeat domain-containing protein, partial [Candidatus Binatia bacterium]
IHRVYWDEDGPQGHPAELRWVVRGKRPDGSRGQLDQRTRVHVQQRDGRWVLTSEEVTARSLITRARPRFEVATRAAGIDSVHTNEGSPVYKITDNLGNAGGCAVADVDGDGWEDLFLAGSPGAVLYRNDGDGTFTDVTTASGLPNPYPDPATGVAFFDYDNDGWPDLYVAAAAEGDRLFRNLGHGRFVDVTASAHIPRGRWASMPIIADYDRDGFLDIYVVRMGDHAERPPHPNHDAHNGVPNTLLRNKGDGTFVDVTAEAGVGDTGWGLAGAWGDYDDDGWPDLYLGNEFGTNALYRNNGDGTFSERTRESRSGDPGAAMGIAWGDYDGDGRADIFVSNMYVNSRWALFHPDFPAPIPWAFRVLGRFTDGVRRRTEQTFEGLTRGDALLHNMGDGTFADVADGAGVRDAQWGWGAEFLDYDNDGRLDVYATNGFVTGELPDDV